jgi:hypothetical protein
MGQDQDDKTEKIHMVPRGPETQTTTSLTHVQTKKAHISYKLLNFVA